MRLRIKSHLKTLALLAALTITGLAALMYNSYGEAISLVKRQFSGNLRFCAEQTAARIEKNVTLLVGQLEYLSRHRSAGEMNLTDAAREIAHSFENVRAYHVNDIGLIDSHGILRLNISAPGIIGTDFSYRSYFKAARVAKTRAPIYEFITFRGADTGAKGIIIAMPILAEEGDFGGVVLFTIKAGELAEEFMPSHSKFGEVWVLDSKGNTIYHSDHEPGTPVKKIEGLKGIAGRIVKETEAGNDYMWEYRSSQGIDTMAVSCPLDIADQKWAVVITMPEGEVLGLVKGFTLPFTLGASGMLFLVVFLAIVVLRMMSGWNRELEATVDVRTGELRESENKHRTLFETMAQGVVYQDREGHITSANPAAAQILGLTLEQMTGRSSMDPRWRTIREDGSAFPGDEHPSMVALRTGKPVRNVVMGVFHPRNEEYRWIKISAVPNFRPGEEKPFQAYTTFDDGTERKLAEEDLQRSRYFLQVVIDGLPEAVMVVNRDYSISLANRTVLEFSDETEPVAGRLTCHQVSHGSGHPCTGDHVCTLQEVFATGKTVVLEHKHQGKAGREITIEVVGSPIFNEAGEVVQVIESCRDITERTELQEKLLHAQKMESIGTLAGGIAHDFNNILTPVMAHVSYMQHSLPRESPLREDLDQIMKATERARELVGHILAFGRREQSKQQPVALQQLIGETLKLLRASIPTTIEIRSGIDFSCASIQANPTQIHQVLMNLCANAHHAMRDKGGLLEVGLESTEVSAPPAKGEPPHLVPGNYARLTVSDTGPGIDSTTMERIFEPYFTTKTAGEGSGLGLAVAHGIVMSHGGGISVRSAPGETLFAVYLPLLSDDVSLQPEEPADVYSGSGRILFVDDETRIVSIADKILSSLGYRMAAFTCSVEALDAFRTTPGKYDLIITDQTMPRMTGVDLARKVLEIRPEIPVIICTGFSRSISEAEAQDIGIKGLVMKPFTLQSLSKAVHSAL